MIYHYLQGFSTIASGCLGFLNHQQYELGCSSKKCSLFQILGCKSVYSQLDHKIHHSFISITSLSLVIVHKPPCVIQMSTWSFAVSFPFVCTKLVSKLRKRPLTGADTERKRLWVLYLFWTRGRDLFLGCLAVCFSICCSGFYYRTKNGYLIEF